MIVIIEEIVRRHPAGKNPSGFIRQNAARFYIADAAIERGQFLLASNDELWLWHESPLNRARKVIIQAVRTITIMNANATASGCLAEIGLLLDVVSEEIHEAILSDRNLPGGANYKSFAEAVGVWP